MQMSAKSEFNELELRETIEDGNSSDESVRILDDDEAIDVSISRNSSYYIDTGMCDEAINSAFTQEESSISYTSSNVLSHLLFKEKNTGIKAKKSLQTCFNCDSVDHSLACCPLPHDQRRISQSRNSLIKNRRRESSRFHEDTENDFKPGLLSDSLREALGIGGNELPEWIYRMRSLDLIHGFPPAYRKRAIEYSVFKMHITGTEDRKRKHSGDSLKIDPEKLIKYPGFNFDDGHFVDVKNENFNIPPWKLFVAGQQARVNEMYINEKSPVMKRQKLDKGLEGNGENEILIVNARPSSGLEEGEIPETTKEAGELNVSSNVLIVDATNVTMRKKTIYEEKTLVKRSEEPSSQEAVDKNDITIPNSIQGRPIFINQHISQSKMSHEISKPTLEKFSLGIQPFQHQEQIERPSGFFKKLQKIVKSSKGKSKNGI